MILPFIVLFATNIFKILLTFNFNKKNANYIFSLITYLKKNNGKYILICHKNGFGKSLKLNRNYFKFILLQKNVNILQIIDFRLM